MNREKILKTISVALFVSMAALIRFNFITEGFIVAMSVLIMGIFIYCYEDLSPMYIAALSGIFSPLFRLILTYIQDGRLQYTLETVLPDIGFFFTYGILYTLIYRFLIDGPKTLRNFTFVIPFCDFFGNVGEMTIRSILAGHPLFTVEILTYLGIIALVRTALVVMVLVAIESYSSFLVRREHDEVYKRLLTQASVVDSEMRLMEKNESDVEEVMKKAYNLYKEAGADPEVPHRFTTQILEIAKNTHEVKADYQNVISVLQEDYLDKIGNQSMLMSEICKLEKANVINLIRRRGYHASVMVRGQADFKVHDSFKMMSVIRNLLTNSAEAIGTEQGRIILTLSAEAREVRGENRTLYYRITVYDNGPGIEKEDLDTIFLDGYSTKFNRETGYIQRGLGLNVVQDYVENVFHGTIAVNSRPGKFTEFTLLIPAKQMEEDSQ